MAKYFVTSYALTSGILEVEGDLSDRVPSMLCYRMEGERHQRYAHAEGRDWHRTRDAALRRANDMRDAKLKSLDKQRKKIAAMQF